MRCVPFVLVTLLVLGSAGISFAAAPVVENVTITGSYNDDNLTAYWDAYDADNDMVYNITNWYLNASNIMVLNMPFEGGSNDSYAKDYSGYGNHVWGAVGNPSWNSSSGYDGFGAFSFDGSGDYLYLLNNPSLNFSGATEISMELWLKPNTLSLWDYMGGKVNNNVWTQGFGFVMLTNNTHMCFAIGGAPSYPCTPIVTGSWQHFVGTYDGTSISIYRNGSLISQDSYTGAIVNPTNAFSLGGDGGTNYFYDGLMDGVRVYNRSLTPEQVALLYQDQPVIHNTTTAVGDVWQACVTPNAGGEDGAQNCSDSLTIQTPQPFTCGDYINTSINFTSNLKNSTGGTLCPGKGLIINASNITIDCKGYSMNGTSAIGTGYRALEIETKSNVTIRNCDINGFGANFNEGSIYVYLSDNITLDNIDFNMPLNTNAYAVHLFRSSDSIINNSRINASSSSGGAKALTIYEDGANQADDNVIENTLLHSQSGHALYLQNGDYNIIKDCNLTSATQDAVYINGPATFNTISDSRIAALYAAMVIWGGANNNTIEGSYLQTANSANLLHIWGSSGIKIIGNSLNHTFTGGISRIILLENNANGLLIMGNNLTNSLPSYSEAGGPLIYVAGGSGYNITGNRFVNPSQNKIYMASGAGGGAISDNWFGPANSAASASALRFAAPSINRTFLLSGNTYVGPKLDIEQGNELLMSDSHFTAIDGTSGITYPSLAFNGSASFRLDEANFFVQDNITAVDTSSAALDPAFNTTARPSFNGVDCNLFSIHYNSSFQTSNLTGSDVVATDEDIGGSCLGGVCTDIACSANTLSFTVPSWSSFGSGNESVPPNVTNVTLYGANVTNHSHHARYNGSSSGNLSTEGGNITGANISSTMLTDRWAAFYGNVSASIVLTGSAGSNYVYSWNWSSADGGVVCLSTNSSFSTFEAAGARGSHIDAAWGFSPSETDSGTNTFQNENCTLGMGSATVANASYADTGPAGGFVTCALRSYTSPSKHQLLFCSDIISGGTFWNGATGDFEVMVPTNETGTETYYFYMNLG